MELRGVARLGDKTFGDCNEHGKDIPGMIVTGSEDTYTNNRATARLGDKVLADCNCVSMIVTGSSYTYVNNRATARLGDKVYGDTYTGMIITASEDTFDSDQYELVPNVVSFANDQGIGFDYSNRPPASESTSDEPDGSKLKYGTPGGGGLAAKQDGGPYTNSGGDTTTDQKSLDNPIVEGGCDRITLGAISEKYESNGNPAAIGFDRNGGYSYGTYQIATKPGTFNNYLNFTQTRYPNLYKFLNDAGGSTAAANGDSRFKDAWASLKSSPDFLKSQHEFIKVTHYDPMAKKIKNATGLDPCDGTHTAGLQDAIWSVAVQHGPNSSIITKAIQSVGAKADDKTIINAIYDERSKVGVYFSKSSEKEQSAIAKRYAGERSDAIRMA